jgi:uncharacterized membrane protein
MNRQEYLRELEKYLKKMPPDEREEVVSDFAEYFDAAAEQGIGEQEVLLKLGTPKSVALEYRALNHVAAAEKKPRFLKVSRAVFSAAASGAVGILGIVPAYIAVVLALVVLYVAGPALMIGGLAGIVAWIAGTGILSDILMMIAPHGPAGIFLSIAALAGGALITLGAYRTGKRALPALVRLMRRFLGKKEEWKNV